MLEGEDFLRRDTGARERFVPLLNIGTRLIDFGLRVPPAGNLADYAGDEPRIVTSAVMALFVSAIKTLRGIQHLGTNALTEPAIMLLRSLSETWAALGFIVSDPAKRAERAHWYLIDEGVENYKWGKKLQHAGLSMWLPDDPARLEALLDDVKKQLLEREIKRQAEDGAQARVEAMLEHMRRGRWAGIPNEEVYAIAERWANGNDDPVAVYATVFSFASGILHVRKPDMLLKMTDGGTIYPNLRADPTFLPFVLFISHLMFVSILRAVNEVFAQRWTRSIQNFANELGAWARAEKSAREAT